MKYKDFEIEQWKGTVAIQERVRWTMSTIPLQYKMSGFVIVGILDAAFRFVSDFSREVCDACNLTVVQGIGFYSCRSYEGIKQGQLGKVDFVSENKLLLENKNVMILDVVVDTGQTMKAVVEDLMKRSVRSVHRVALVASNKGMQFVDNKPWLKEDFLVGYGLDYKGKCRELNSLYRLVREKGEKL